LFLTTISGLFATTSLSVCTPWLHNIVTSSCSHSGLCVCFYHLSVMSMPILNNVNVQQLYHVSLSIHSSPKWGILKLGGQ
jgi:hypothetical protein